ncbi:MAG: C25 family cysteine peptidase [bacterium]|nr:C25 family cysteine peptidase [bacterium]
MKRILTLLPVFSLLFGFFTALPLYGQLPLVSEKHSAIEISSQSLGIGHLRIQVTNPQVQFEQISQNDRNWTMLSIDGESYVPTIGEPMVPTVQRPVRVPDRGNVSVRIVNSSYTEYSNIDVLPMQTIPANPTDQVAFTYHEDSYTQDCWYPEVLATISDPVLLRDARIAMLAISPVQVNPVTRSVRVYDSIELETVPMGGQGVNELNHPVGPVPSFAAFYREVLGCDDLAADAAASQPGTILLIHRDDTIINALVNPWKDWKIASGRPCRTLTYTPPTVLNAGIILSAILEAYNSVTPPLEEIVIVGDEGPTSSYWIPGSTTGYGATDHNYTMLAGNDILGDVFLGRFSCENAAQLATMINRSINYEKTPTMSETEWYTRAWGYAGVSNNQYDTRTTTRFCLDQLLLHGINQQFYDEHTGSVNAILINQRFAIGVSHWAHNPSYVGQIYDTDISGIQNTGKYFFSMHLASSTGNWSGSTGLNESLIRLGTPNNPRGAIATVATATSGTHWQFERTMSAGIYYGLGTLNLHQPGPMTWMGKFQLWRNHHILDSSMVNNHTRWNNLMGDPTALLWSGVPRFLTTTYPDTIGLSQNQLSLHIESEGVPVPDLLVTVWKTNETGENETYYRARTDSAGQVLLQLSNRSIGSLFVTAIGDQADANYYPIHDTIAVVQWSGDIGLMDYMIVDDNLDGRIGNNDNTANPGETIDIDVRLTNRGQSATISGITGTLTSSDSRVTILQGNQSWNSLSPGAFSAGVGMFRVQLLTGLLDNEIIPLHLWVVTSDSTFNRNVLIPLTIRSIDVEGVSLAIENLNGDSTWFIPGGNVFLNASIRNIGGLGGGLTQATVFSNSNYLSFLDPTGIFTSLPIGVIVSNSGVQRFEICANIATIPGSQFTVGIALTDGAVIDTVYFSLTVGTRSSSDPTGSDSYGYVAYDDTDTSYSMCPHFDWVEIRTNGLGTRLPLNDNVETADASIHATLPFPVQYYGNVFDTVLICSNGWFAFGGQQRAGLPLYNNFRNTPLPTSNGPTNLVCPFWENLVMPNTQHGVWVYHDTTNHTFVLTWYGWVFGNNSINEFQAIIRDELYWPTYSNDAMILFQYKVFNNIVGDNDEPDYATIGISEGTFTDGIEFSYMNQYTPGSAIIANSSDCERAILFTTTQSYITGSITGRVTHLSDGSPVDNATVQVLTGGRLATTDWNGEYFLSEVLIGDYNVIVTKPGYNDTTRSINVSQDSTTILNFVMTMPEFAYSVLGGDSASTGQIYCRLLEHNDTELAEIGLFNHGNGLLEWSSSFVYNFNVDEVDTTWEELYSFPASSNCGDRELQGIEFDGNSFWVVGSHNSTNPNRIYQFDRAGYQQQMLNQSDNTSLIGYRDLAWDGEFFYGSSSRLIEQFDTLGVVHRSYEALVNPARALACDTSNGLLYYADWMSPIYALRLNDGITTQVITNSFNVVGMAYYPSDRDGYPLYAVARLDGIGMQIVKFNPITGESMEVVTIPTTEVVYGAAITSSWNPMVWTLLVLMRNPVTFVNRVVVYELEMNRDWFTYSPSSGSVAPGDSAVVQITLNSLSLPADHTFRANLLITNNSTTRQASVPITMFIESRGNAEESLNKLPQQFALESVYPNPFNGQAAFVVALPIASEVSLVLYDQLGRETARLLQHRPMNAGRHTVRFNSTSLASGVYYARFQSGEYSSTRKIVLLK